MSITLWRFSPASRAKMLLSASLFTLTVAIVGVSVDGYPDWANEKRFGKFQDAWTSIGQDPSVIYYLARTDYKDDVGSWGEGFKCVAVRETNKNDEEKVSCLTFLQEQADPGR
uniref:Secreted protein n=1 Tax=Amblyomma triste TaxID=251400 RepID=A0A023G486_AMBTT